MFAQRDVHRSVTIVDREILVRDRTGEDEALIEQPILGHQRANRCEVAGDRVISADEDETVERVDVALVVFGKPDVIFDALVRGDAPDEQEIDELAVEQRLQGRPAGRSRHARQSRWATTAHPSA